MGLELERFLSQIYFNAAQAGSVGIERGRFLVGINGAFAPLSPLFLGRVGNPLWTYELSACQVEDRILPARDRVAVKLGLIQNDNTGGDVASSLDLRFSTNEVADETLPLAVYPDRRYLKIVRSLDQARLSAACRVTGTHIHLGVGSFDEALLIHNALASRLEELCVMGDHSDGERLRLYRAMAVHWDPPQYLGKDHFFETARSQGFVGNVRDCWHLVRISRHGTVECRMFGVACVDEILHWVEIVQSIVKAG